MSGSFYFSFFGQKSAVIIKQNEDFFVQKIQDSEM